MIRSKRHIILLNALVLGVMWVVISCQKDPFNVPDHLDFSATLDNTGVKSTQNARTQLINLKDGTALKVTLTKEDIPELTSNTKAMNDYDSASEITSFGLFGYNYPSTESWNTARTPSIFNAEAVKSGSVYTTSSEFVNPASSSRKTKYFAYAPYGSDRITLSSASATGSPTLTYTVNSNISSDFSDLIIGSSPEYTSATAVPALSFSHILSYIDVQQKNTVLNSDTMVLDMWFEGINRTGSYTIGSGWTSRSNIGSADASCLGDFSTEESGQNLTHENYHTLMIPQTVPAGGALWISLHDIAADMYDISFDISGDVWQPGCRTLYRVSFAQLEEFYIDKGSITLEYGASQTVTVSYRPYAYSNFTYSLNGAGLSATRSGDTITITNCNNTDSDVNGSIVFTSETGNIHRTCSILARKNSSVIVDPGDWEEGDEGGQEW